VTGVRTTTSRRLLRLAGDADAPRFTGLDARLCADLLGWLATDPAPLPDGLRAELAAAVVVCLPGECPDAAVRRLYGVVPPPSLVVLPSNGRELPQPPPLSPAPSGEELDR